MNVTHLESALCRLRHEANIIQNLCVECGKPLLVRYDLEKAAETLKLDSLASRESSLWRYREVLPVENPVNIVTFGEGWTPLLRADRLAKKLPIKLNLFIKDEGQNPTQSFKARGMTAAISMAKELGVKKVAVPSAGNAAGAMAAYAARAGMEAFIFMPSDTPRANIVECEQTGATRDARRRLDHRLRQDRRRTKRCRGLVRCLDPEGAVSRRRKEDDGLRACSNSSLSIQNPKSKIQNLPDVIVYPTGGGTGLIGMWKAFDEMEQMGWIGFTPSANGDSPIGNLRSDREGVRPWRKIRRRIRKRFDCCIRAARSKSDR